MYQTKTIYKNLTRTSLTLSSLTIAVTVALNVQIYLLYERANVKTKIWFGLDEYLRYGIYKYYLFAGCSVSIVLAVFGLLKSENQRLSWLALLVGSAAGGLVFVRLWALMADVAT